MLGLAVRLEAGLRGGGVGDGAPPIPAPPLPPSTSIRRAALQKECKK